jgi:predicted nucleotidyltransferase
MTLDDLVRQLQQVHGSALDAIVLYGSAARGDDVAGQSDLNVLVIVRTLPAETLRALGQTMRAWQEAGHPPVLTFTSDEWRASADIFPMEYADILEQHRVLAGTLPLDGVQVVLSDLRLQLEHEAMGKLLRFRRSVMVAGTDHARQLELLRASASTLLVIFRAVVRLHGEVPPREADAVLQAVARRTGLDPRPFQQGAALRRGATLEPRETEAVLAGILAGMTTLVSYLDHFVPSDPAAAVGSPPVQS